MVLAACDKLSHLDQSGRRSLGVGGGLQLDMSEYVGCCKLNEERSCVEEWNGIGDDWCE